MPFELDAVNRALRISGLELRYTGVTGSTNADLLNDPSAGPGSVLIAGAQTAGRGRMERAFASPEGGLYMSVLLRPISAADALLITPRAAVAVARAVEDVAGRETGIKWVNDVLIGGKKVCGILAEARAGEHLDVVLGIGVNVFSVPEGLEDTAGAVFSAPAEQAREKLSAAILNELFATDCDVHAEYVRRCVVPGHEVTVHGAGGTYRARALAVDERFHLIVERSDGSREALDSGEVSVRL